METTKALLFDMDGTLVNTEYLDEKAMNSIFKKYKIKKTQNFIGCTLDEYLTSTIKEKGLRRKIRKDFLEEYISLLRKTELELNNKILKILKKKSGIKAALVTSNNKKLTNFILEKIGMSDFFDVVITCENIENQKPHPDPYLKAIKKLNVNPKNCLVFEDTEIGVKSAEAAGLECIKVKIKEGH